MSPSESYPQHVVTAVIVAHDGAAWLPGVAQAVLGQTRPVQRVVAVDTGSRDRSGAVLSGKFGQGCVFGMERTTGYAAAVGRALQHRAAHTAVPASSGYPAQERIEWLWLLHDDCEPAPDALEQLLRGAAEATTAAVLGPKLRDLANREVILEAGVTLDTAGRRLTGIEPREVDQGQHDGDRDALAVSSAGMLVRRDVWEQVGGFDTSMALFMEDIDFCWRVHAAGYRVRVVTDAVAYHMQAAARHRRPVSVGRRARMLDRRNGLLTLLGNLPVRQMLTAAIGNTTVSLLRILFFLLAKRMVAALDEAAALAAVLGHPLRLLSRRRRRSRGRRSAYSRIRADLPPGRSVRRVVEFAASTLITSGQVDTVGAHHASADPTDDDSILVDNGGFLRRLLTSPGVLVFISLLAVALVAARPLLRAGPLGGGALIPAWGGASDLWNGYLQAFHASGVGSSGAAPPYLAVIAMLATLLGGKPWLAIDVLLLGCVPLAGLSALIAVRKVTSSRLVRVWAAITYALLPVAMGVVAAGRFGTALAFVLLPVIVALAGRAVTAGGRQARRAAWATGLLVALGAMFVPLVWLAALAACAAAAIVWRNTRPGLLLNLVIVSTIAPVLLLPWTRTLVSHPAALLLEAGVQRPGISSAQIAARSLLLLSPGGPGLPPFWVSGGLLAAAFAALFAARQRALIVAGWGLATCGLLLAIAVSRLTVVPPGGAGRVAVWAGVPLAIAAIGLLLAAAAGADSLARPKAGRSGRRAALSSRGAWAAIVGLVACSAPLLAAASWLVTGVSGPVRPQTRQLVPELVAMADGLGRQVRTLVLTGTADRVSYQLLRGPSPSLADAALQSTPSAQSALDKAVAALIAPDGGTAVEQSQLLADFDIGYVLVEAPVDPQLASTLDDVAGLSRYSTTGSFDLWQLQNPPARISVAEPSGATVPIASGPVGVSGARVPAAGGILMLAEPAGGWHAFVNGRALTPVRSPAGAWAQAFKLPPGGGTLDVGYNGLRHDVLLAVQALALLVLIGLALPGVRAAEADGLNIAAGSARDEGEKAADGEHAAPGASRAGHPSGAGAAAGLAGAAAVAGHAARRPSRDRPQRGRGGARRVTARRDRSGRDVAAAPVAERAQVRRAGQHATAGAGGAEPATARLADAWPYAASDEAADQLAEPAAGYELPAWSKAQASATGTAERTFAGTELELRRTGPGGRQAGAVERTGAWPYQGRTEHAGQGGRPELAGRSPSGRPPSGSWPHPQADELDQDSGLPRRPVRSPSGWLPPAGDEPGRRELADHEPAGYERGDYDQGSYRHGDYGQGDYGQGDYGQGGHRHGGYQPVGYEPAGYESGGYEPAGAGVGARREPVGERDRPAARSSARDGRHAAADRTDARDLEPVPDSDRRGRGGSGGRRAGRRLVGRSGRTAKDRPDVPEPEQAQAPDTDAAGADRAPSGRRGRLGRGAGTREQDSGQAAGTARVAGRHGAGKPSRWEQDSERRDAEYADYADYDEQEPAGRGTRSWHGSEPRGRWADDQGEPGRWEGEPRRGQAERWDSERDQAQRWENSTRADRRGQPDTGPADAADERERRDRDRPGRRDGRPQPRWSDYDDEPASDYDDLASQGSGHGRRRHGRDGHDERRSSGRDDWRETDRRPRAADDSWPGARDRAPGESWPGRSRGRSDDSWPGGRSRPPSDDSWPGGRPRPPSDDSWPGGRDRVAADDSWPGAGLPARRGRPAGGRGGQPALGRGSEQLPAWPGGAADALEPLPPLDDAAATAGSQTAWLPADTGDRAGSGQWRRGRGPDDDSRGGRFRRSGSYDDDDGYPVGGAQAGDRHADDERDGRRARRSRARDYEGESW